MKFVLDYYAIELDISEEEVEMVFWNNNMELRPENHIKEIINFIKEKGIKIGVISNFPLRGRTMHKYLNEYLNNSIEFVVTSADYTFRKPHPDIFEVALRKAQVKPENAMHCGDNFEADIKGAMKAA